MGGGAGGAGAGSAGGAVDGGPDCTVQEYRDLMVPMRDGKALAAFGRLPVDPRCQVPTVLIQTPYGKENARSLWFGDAGVNPLFASTDYAFVVEDWRGFFGSAAAKVVGTQPYGQDGYDTVEWIASQPFSDGKVGTWGVSALCVQQYRTAVLKPPHLSAAVPIFCELNTTYGQYYPGGVLRREYFAFISTYFGGGAAITGAPYRSPLWTAVESALSPSDVDTPVMLVAGWYDLYPAGSLSTWSELLASSPQSSKHRLLIGEWIHYATGGESAGGRPLTAQELQWVDSGQVVQRDSLAFFDLHLRGLSQSPAAQWQKVRYSRSGTWLAAPAWPPTGASVDYLLASTGELSVTAPAVGQLSLPYAVADPSPTLGGGTLLPSLTHGPTDQSPVSARGDAVTFKTPALSQPLDIAGHLALHLEVATDQADTDFSARLVDVQPDGGQLLLAEGIRRLKLRGSYAAPLAVVAGARYGLDIPFTADLAYRFELGHRVGLIVTSSNYPRFDRNPNTGADFVPDGGAPVNDARNTLYLDGTAKLTLPVQ
jgi:predicted acyl esterase